MSAPAPEVTPGTRLGDFVLVGLLGQGGGGTVYAARWGHRPVALKVLREDLLPDASERRRFLEEARLLAEVNHPGVVRILGYGALPDGRPYLAMEQLEGESLAERVRRGAMAPEPALSLFGQLALAVQALHDRGLVHRDIKPENVFLVQEGRHAVLLDFGIAKAQDAPASTVTRQGGVRGTPAYMAPERFFGAPASPATDLYELGVVLFAMLTGQLPWEITEDPVARLNPRRPRDLGIELPGRLEEVLLSTLSTRAENRPASARELTRQLGEALTQQPERAARRTADLELPTITRDLGPGPRGRGDQTGPGQTDLGFCTTQATPSKPSVSFVGVTTQSRATGESMPLLALPSSADQRPEPARRLPRLLLGGGIALAILGVGLAFLMTRQELRVGPAGEPGAAAAATMPEAISRGPAFDQLLWGLHPDDTFLILRLHHEELQRSGLWKTFHEGLVTHPSLAPIVRIRKRCGLDLLSETRWISVGIAGSPEAPEVDAVLRGRWTRERVERCLQGFGSAQETPATVERLGLVSRIQLGDHFVYLAWPDEDTFMLSTRASASPAWFRARLAKRQPLWTREALVRAYEGLDPDDTLTLLTTEADFEAHAVLKTLPRPDGLALSLRTRGDLLLKGTFSYRDDAAATRAEGELRRLLASLLSEQALLKLLLKDSRVTRRGPLVEASFEISESTSRLVGQALASALKDTPLALPRRREAEPDSRQPAEAP